MVCVSTAAAARPPPPPPPSAAALRPPPAAAAAAYDGNEMRARCGCVSGFTCPRQTHAEERNGAAPESSRKTVFGGQERRGEE